VQMPLCLAVPPQLAHTTEPDPPPCAPRAQRVPLPPLPNRRSLGYTGPRLASRPDLSSISPRQVRARSAGVLESIMSSWSQRLLASVQAGGCSCVASALPDASFACFPAQVLEAHGRVVFDDADARMAAWDALDVTVAAAAAVSSAAGGPGAGAGGSLDGSPAADGAATPWAAAEARLASFNDLSVPQHLRRRMKKARLNRPTPIQRCLGQRLGLGRAGWTRAGQSKRSRRQCCCRHRRPHVATAPPRPIVKRLPPSPKPPAHLPRQLLPPPFANTVPRYHCCRRATTRCWRRPPAAARPRPTSYRCSQGCSARGGGGRATFRCPRPS
jgi:hypothetical protein